MTILLKSCVKILNDDIILFLYKYNSKYVLLKKVFYICSMNFEMTVEDFRQDKHKSFTKLVIKGVNSTIDGEYTIKEMANFGNGFWFYTNEAHTLIGYAPMTKGQSVDGWDVTFFRNRTELRVTYKSNKNYMEKRIQVDKFYFI